MPPKRFDQARPFLTLAVIVVAWTVLPVVFKAFVRASFFEFTAPLTYAASDLRDVQTYWSERLHTKNELIEAGHDLARLNASYALAAQRNIELASEVARLEALLRLPPYANFRAEQARVVRRDFSGWWQQLVIRKGTNYGIVVGAPVVFTGGVVGRVTEVHRYESVVELIGSPGVRLAAEFEGDTRPISFQGGENPTFGPAKGEIDFVPLDVFASPMLPKKVVTSGLGSFPPGLVLGTVTKLEPSPDGLFKTGVIQLDPRLSDLTEVTVLVPLKSE